MEWCDCNCDRYGAGAPTDYPEYAMEKKAQEHDPADRHAACRKALLDEEEKYEQLAAEHLTALVRAQAFEEVEQDISRLRAVTGYPPGFADGVESALRAAAALREKARKP